MKKLEDIKVGVDIGHGIDTKGKGYLDFKEHTFNSIVAMLYIKEMKLFGFKDENFKLGQQPNSLEVPLYKRYDHYHGNDMYISFHADANSSKSANGLTLYHWDKSAGGIKMANIFKDEFIKASFNIRFRAIDESDLNPNDGTWDNFGILREPKAFGLLIEHGFMTNDWDRTEMSKRSVQEKFAKVWAKASVKYLIEEGILDESELVPYDEKKEANQMGERIDIRIKTSGKIIEDLEKKTIDKVGLYLDNYEVVVEEEKLYSYAGYPLKKGMYNDPNNAVLQRALKELGYYNMPIDNHFGNGMHNAIINLQVERNLDVTGIVTERVADEINKALIEKRDKVENPATPTKPDTSEFDNFKPLVKLIKPFGYYTKFGQTRPVQFALREIDKLEYDIEVDGHFGRGSQSALNTYKKSKGLPQDGLVDELTWKHLHFDLWKKQENEDLKINWYDNQTKIIRVKKDEIDFDVIMGRQPVESLPSVWNRLEEKPLLLTNGCLYGMTNGKTLGLVIDEGREVEFGYYSKWFLGQAYSGDIKLYGGHWEKQINNGSLSHIKEGIGASPSLVIGGKKNVDLTGLDNPFITSNHPRLVYGLDDEYLYVIIVHGRQSIKGYYGENIEGLVDICLDLGLIDAINLDGGWSIMVLDKNKNRIDDSTSVRRVDNMVALFKR